MTTKMIGLDDISAISTAEEGRAVALALFNQLQVKISLINALECFESWLTENGCKCGHPWCEVCQETIIVEDVIARAKGGA